MKVKITNRAYFVDTDVPKETAGTQEAITVINSFQKKVRITPEDEAKLEATAALANIEMFEDKITKNDLFQKIEVATELDASCLKVINSPVPGLSLKAMIWLCQMASKAPKLISISLRLRLINQIEMELIVQELAKSKTLGNIKLIFDYVDNKGLMMLTDILCKSLKTLNILDVRDCKIPQGSCYPTIFEELGNALPPVIGHNFEVEEVPSWKKALEYFSTASDKNLVELSHVLGLIWGITGNQCPSNWVQVIIDPSRKLQEILDEPIHQISCIEERTDFFYCIRSIHPSSFEQYPHPFMIFELMKSKNFDFAREALGCLVDDHLKQIIGFAFLKHRLDLIKFIIEVRLELLEQKEIIQFLEIYSSSLERGLNTEDTLEILAKEDALGTFVGDINLGVFIHGQCGDYELNEEGQSTTRCNFEFAQLY